MIVDILRKQAAFYSTRVRPAITRAAQPIPKALGVNPLDMFDREQMQKLGQNLERKMVDSPYGRAGSMAVAGAALSYGASIFESTFDPLGLPSMTYNVASFAAHTTAGLELANAGGLSKALGLGYLAALAVNTLRDGDNLGPM